MDTVRQFSEDAIELIKASLFSEDAVERIKASLPVGSDQRRLDLLPLILAEWAVHHLPEHLSRESSATVRKRFASLLKVGKRANELRQAIDATDQRGRAWIAVEMAREQGNLSDLEKVAEIEERLIQQSDFLNNLAAATTKLMEKKPPSRGSRNIRAYLVMMDLAAIFEWLTDRKATREVDRICGKETGPFWDFVATVWPSVFGKGLSGLPSAIKNWAELRSLYGEASQLLRNIAMHHPAWGIFSTTRQ
jgi:hypothetical protein